MTFAEVTALLGGLALFLFGMKMMSDGLEQAAGDKMKQILEKLTGNRFLGVAVGAGITAVIQSSSATTVMVVGFVNSGLMTLKQAIWVIMGANIGTTVTGQLIALDIGMIAPFFAVVGVVFIVFLKSRRLHHLGYIVGGLGVLFIGMTMMSDSMIGLRDSETFVQAVTNLSNPLLGILAGALFTAVIQSSSASVGILQALAMSGSISFGSAVFVLFGQNIGTCITAVLASIGTSRNARRSTIIHLMFNTIGTAVFTLICILTPFCDWMAALTPGNPAAQIANVHTVFNLVTTALLLPFGSVLAAAARVLLPERPEESANTMKLQFISPNTMTQHTIGSVSVAVSQIHNEVCHMLELARSNVKTAFDNMLVWSADKTEQVEQDEEYVDFLNAEISKYISLLLSCEMTEQDARTIGSYFKIIGNVERISDHAVNISEYATLLHKKGWTMPDALREEVTAMQETALQSLEQLAFYGQSMPRKTLLSVNLLEKRIDALSETYRGNQLDRLRDNTCSGDVSVIYSEMITDFERIGDHVLNIAELASPQIA